MADTPPTDDEVAAAQAIIAKAKLASVSDAEKAMIQLVGMKAYSDCYAAMTAAQTLNPGNTELNYAISMMHRLSQTHTPT